MSVDLDKLTTEELEAALEKRRLEAMSKEQLIDELKKAKQSNDRPVQTHQDLLKLADNFGIDVNEALKVDELGFNVGLFVLKMFSFAALGFTLLAVIGVWSDSSTSLGDGERFSMVFLSLLILLFGLAVSYAFYWLAQKQWLIGHKKYDGRNLLKD